MIRSLNTAVSGLQEFQQRMDVISNNIANVNTTGYKSSRTDSADSFSETLQSAGAGVAGMQIGSGVKTAAIKNNFTQGTLSSTGVQTDLAVSGNGFFLVRDTLSNDTFATRAGDFRLDANNYLITDRGQRVQGYNDTGLGTLGDIQIDAAQRPASAAASATLTAYRIDTDGKVYVRLSDGTEYARGQVLLENYADTQSLLKEGDNLFSNLDAAGRTGLMAPGSTGFGKVESGSLELSNVDLSAEFSNMIVTQRAFQANARSITTSDEMLQELVNLKR